jgi:hypothetical protein
VAMSVVATLHRTTECGDISSRTVFGPRHRLQGKQAFELGALRGSYNPLKMQNFGHPY